MVGLGTYPIYTRLFFHAISIFFLYLGTKMTVIGLTGGISCGKSTVVDIMKEKGGNAFKIIDCDKITHDLYKDDAFVKSVFKTFGKEAVVAADGKSVDRAKLGAIVFADKAKRNQLNRMTHGPIFATILKTIFRLRVLQGEPLVVLDAPLLFESRILEYICHPIIVVSIEKEETQLKRLMERNKGLKKDEALSKIKSQMSMHAKEAKADLVLDNNSSRDDLKTKVSNWLFPEIFRILKLDG